jgi:hypothetical protein
MSTVASIVRFVPVEWCGSCAGRPAADGRKDLEKLLCGRFSERPARVCIKVGLKRLIVFRPERDQGLDENDSHMTIIST